MRIASTLTLAAAMRSDNCARATVAPAPESVVAFLSSVSQSATNVRKSRVNCSRSGDTALSICVMVPPSPRAATASAFLSMASSLSAFRQRQQERHERNNQEYDEQDLRDASRSGCNAAEPEQRRDQRNDKKNDCVVQHCKPPLDSSETRLRRRFPARRASAVSMPGEDAWNVRA